jgi:hypothetical protein
MASMGSWYPRVCHAVTVWVRRPRGARTMTTPTGARCRVVSAVLRVVPVSVADARSLRFHPGAVAGVSGTRLRDLPAGPAESASSAQATRSTSETRARARSHRFPRHRTAGTRPETESARRTGRGRARAEADTHDALGSPFGFRGVARLRPSPSRRAVGSPTNGTTGAKRAAPERTPHLTPGLSRPPHPKCVEYGHAFGGEFRPP